MKSTRKLTEKQLDAIGNWIFTISIGGSGIFLIIYSASMKPLVITQKALGQEFYSSNILVSIGIVLIAVGISRQINWSKARNIFKK